MECCWVWSGLLESIRGTHQEDPMLLSADSCAQTKSTSGGDEFSSIMTAIAPTTQLLASNPLKNPATRGGNSLQI